jgi:ribonuclease BN (tRNA processing enzyme)
MYNQIMKDRLVILGSGTANLVPEKAASSVLIEIGGVRLVYDFGRGASIRLAQIGLKQNDIEHIFLSHFHPDHVTDLYPFLHAASWSQIDKRNKDINIYGPVGTKDFVQRLLAVFDWRHEFSNGFEIHVHDINAKNLVIGDQVFEVFDLHHSQGLKFGRYAIAGDANISDDLINLLSGVDLGVFDSGHTTDNEIVQLAVRTQAKKLACSHQYRMLDQEVLNKAAKAQGFSGKLIVAEDLMSFELA